jgi:Protein of unknown function DUF262
MRKQNITWTIRELESKSDLIEFPEFQREPTVWDLDKKRKLIDSILRDFDIASIYLYRSEQGTYECIDGRQRINAIVSFLGLNEESDPAYDNNFTFRSSSELFEQEDKELEEFNGKTFKDLLPNQKERIFEYRFNVLELSNIEEDEDLNLMFLRLQLGSPLNAGEKLNAMRGDMKDLIFKGEGSLGQHPYLTYLQIPRRRFSKELTAAQIAANFFTRRLRREFTRVRFIDLQEFLKAYSTFNAGAKQTADRLRARLNQIYSLLEARPTLGVKNRAMGISLFFFLDQLIETDNDRRVPEFLDFFQLFLGRLKEQVEKGFNIDPQYRDLLKFQTYISQAAVEKYAIENRHRFLEEYFDYYLQQKKIKGD